MANIQSAIKRARQSEKRRRHNKAMRSRLRTHVKRVIAAIQKGDKDAAVDNYKAAVPVIDSMTNKGILHKNKAARHKRRLNEQLKGIAGLSR